jgi:hypothetical protein
MRATLVYGVFSCLSSYAPWRTHRYAVCPVWPSCAIMNEIQGYFSPTHWGICLLKIRIFYSLDHRSRCFFARTWKRTSWRARRYAGCPWGRHACSWDAIWVNKCAKKKRALFNHPCRINDFFVVKACTPVHMRVRQSKNCEFLKIIEGSCVTNLATGNPNLDPNRLQNEI